MASIKDVAEAAGVSTATVSRVLSDHPHVRPAVRDRVLAVIAQLNYRPNLVARTLRSQQSNTIGLIVSDIRNPFFSSISRAVEDTAYRRGYRVIVCNTDEDGEKEKLYLRLMHDEHVAGVLWSPTHSERTPAAGLNLDFPLVLVDRFLEHGDLDAVLLDNLAAAYQLTRHLIERGYRRIGAIFGEAHTTGRERRRGYEAALRDHGLAPPAELVKYVPPQLEAGRDAALHLLRAPQPPDAIVTGNSLLTAGALQAVRQSKLIIPDQVALAGFDETIWASLLEPPITVIAQPTDEIGTIATELLLQRIADPQRPVRKVILKGQLIERPSSAPRQVEADQIT